MDRRGFLRGLGAALAAPAIVQVANIMPVVARPSLIAPPIHLIEPVGNGLFRVSAKKSGYVMSLVTNAPTKVKLNIGNEQMETGIKFGSSCSASMSVDESVFIYNPQLFKAAA